MLRSSGKACHRHLFFTLNACTCITPIVLQMEKLKL